MTACDRCTDLATRLAAAEAERRETAAALFDLASAHRKVAGAVDRLSRSCARIADHTNDDDG